MELNECDARIKDQKQKRYHRGCHPAADGFILRSRYEYYNLYDEEIQCPMDFGVRSKESATRVV